MYNLSPKNSNEDIKIKTTAQKNPLHMIKQKITLGKNKPLYII